MRQVKEEDFFSWKKGTGWFPVLCLFYLVWLLCSVCLVCSAYFVCFVYGRFPRDSACGGASPPPSVGLSSASGDRASPGSESRKIEAPPPWLRQARRGMEASRSGKGRTPWSV